MNYTIRLANVQDAEKIAFIISNSNKNIAEKFGITFENNPKHPSFYTKEWVLKDLERGEKYFLYQENDKYMGCIAFEHSKEEKAYLNRLAAIPMYRHNGIGKKLVTHIIKHARKENIKTQGATKVFSHLPFDVTFMQYKL